MSSSYVHHVGMILFYVLEQVCCVMPPLLTVLHAHPQAAGHMLHAHAYCFK